MPFAFNDSQLSVIVAGQRLLRRAVANLGVRFADYLVVDGGFATAPFLHAAGEVGLPVVARLKETCRSCSPPRRNASIRKPPT